MAETSKDSENQPTSSRLGVGRATARPKPNEEAPPPAMPTTSSWRSNGGSAWGSSEQRSYNNDRNNNNDDNSNSFGSRGQRGGFSGPRGGSGACYNCNQSGHMARDCPEPRQERNNGGSRQSNYNRDRDDSYRGGRGGGRGGGYGDDRRGGYSGGRGGNYGDDQNTGGFRSTTQTEGGSFSVTIKNNSGQNERSPFSSGQGASNPFSSGGRGPTTFENSNRHDGASSSRGGFSSGGSNFHSGNRQDPSDYGEKRSYTDSHNQRDSHDDNRPPPKERYAPEAPPTSEDGVFGTATHRGVNFEKYHNAHVSCTPEDRVHPIDLFDEAGFPTRVMANTSRANLKDPTAIQRYAIPCIRQEDDLMACAQTGAGKTAAFLLPIISNLMALSEDELLRKHNPPAPLCLILSPTRDLALQTEREARKFAFETPIKTCSAIGGHDLYATSDRMKDGCHILSATTGRLKDMIEKGRLQLNYVKYLVLDEADRMLDSDFIPDIQKLLELGLPQKNERVTSMFSATFPEAVQNLAKDFLREHYVFLAVGTIGGANEDITQTIEEVPMSRKKDRLFELLAENLKDERCLIFVETKRSADYLGTLLSQRNLMSTTMHGDRTQQQRDIAVKQFTNGMCPILVATSVAARGLDFPLIGYVINYDLPNTSDFYIHRIGRTGRAGHLGKSISFFDPQRDSDIQIAPDLVKNLVDAGQPVPDFLSQYGRGSSNSRPNNQSTRENNTDMRSSGHGFRGRGGYGSQTFHSSGGRGGTSSAGRAQEEQW